MIRLPDYIAYQADFVVQDGKVTKSKLHPIKRGTELTLKQFLDTDIKNSVYVDENSVYANRFTGVVRERGVL